MSQGWNGESAPPHNTRYVWSLACVAALGGLLFGYDTAVISGAIGFLTERFQLSEDLQGWAVSSALVGCIFGAAFAGALSDLFGRKKVLIATSILFTVSAIASALPRNLTEFVVARMLGGFGIGAASMLSPLYIAEIAPAGVRGRLVSVNQFAIISGMLVVYFVNAMIAYIGDRMAMQAWNVAYGWRWMFGSET
ncbi:MAG TPA: MFS transporter, partial [Candidatus Hydrogenedentes bacterium]|nr:MFS transporter [Candidatus Hydrogenedentota bacterium]